MGHATSTWHGPVHIEIMIACKHPRAFRKMCQGAPEAIQNHEGPAHNESEHTRKPPQVHTTAAASGSAASTGAGTAPSPGSTGARLCSPGATRASASANAATSACMLAMPKRTACGQQVACVRRAYETSNRTASNPACSACVLAMPKSTACWRQ